MKRSFLFALAALTAVACGENEDMLAPDSELSVAEGKKAAEVAPRRTFEITVENITSPTYMDGHPYGQWFTPPILVVSQKAEDLFTVGKAASYELQQVAENGAVGAFVEALDVMNNNHISSVGVGVSAGPPPLAPDASVTLELHADPGSNFFSAVSMLICTNDGFTGIDGAKLPEKVGEAEMWYAEAYDAGTEINTEDAADLVPPCQFLGGAMGDMDEDGTGSTNPDLYEGGVIHHHPGIMGSGELAESDLDPAVHGWMGPVAKFTITRIH